MKRLLALLAGFSLTLGVFAAGAAGTFFFLVAEPVDVKRGPQQDIAELWSPQPRSVEPQEQDFQRVAGPADVAAAQRPDEETGTAADDNGQAGIDMTTTAALPDDASPPAAASEDGKIASDFLDERLDRAVTAHVEWCAQHYRSYRPRDNSYTPYSGGRRTCVSPYSEEILAAEAGAPDGYAPQLEAGAANQMQYVADDAGDWVSEEHRQYCASRYRSYRPQDNTYQPYGGGPRKECL